MADWTETDITTKASPRSVADTVSRLTGMLAAKGLKMFAVIDQAPRRARADCTCGRPCWCCSAARPRARR